MGIQMTEQEIKINIDAANAELDKLYFDYVALRKKLAIVERAIRLKIDLSCEKVIKKETNEELVQ